MMRIAMSFCTVLVLSMGVARQTAQAAERETYTGDRLDPATYGTAVSETVAEMMARDRAGGQPAKIKGRNEAQGRWVIPSRRSDNYAHSGEHNLINEWGDTRMSIGFPRTVELHGAFISGQEGEGVWTSSIRVRGYLGDKLIKTTDWFTDIGSTPQWFAMDLPTVDRIIIESTPVVNGGGWYGLDDLTYTVIPYGGTDERAKRVVLDFEDADYRQVLTGSDYAGLTWELGSGDFDASAGIPAPQPVELPVVDPDPDAVPDIQLRGGGGTTPILVDSFQGPIRSDSGFSFPPDTCGAVGPNHFVSIVNVNLSIYLKSTGARLSSMSLDSFFSPFNTGGDPRILYDQYSGRWIAISTTFNGGQTVQLAVSHTSDPMGTWFKTQFSVDQGSDTGCWPDYPTLGVNEDGIYITSYMVGCGMTIFAIDKAPLIAASPSLGTITAFRGLSLTGAIQPVHSFGSVVGEYFIDAATSIHLRVRHLTGPLTAPTLTDLGLATVPSYSTPPDAPALGSTTPLDTVGTRLMNATYRVGRIWTAHAINANGRAACRWYEINPFPNPPEMVQSGTIDDPSLHYFFPSIMVNDRGDTVMGFSGSNSAQYAAAYFTGRSFLDPIGQTAPPTLYRSGGGAQNLIDSFGRNRFGDYSLCSLDPDNERDIWTIQEFGHSNNIWGTHIAHLAYGDCNNNGVPDNFDISGGTSLDCNNNSLPDECELGGDDCNTNGAPDECDITVGTALDCDANTVPDSCDIATGVALDCNGNGIPDNCDLSTGFSLDCNINGFPDDCELAAGTSADCNGNTIPDVCDTAPGGGSDDCNGDTVPDQCQLAGNDCDANNRPDDCDAADLAAMMVGPFLQTPCPDGIATFDVSIAGADSYQWLRNGSEVLTDGGAFSGTTTPTLTIDPAGDGGELSTYLCRVAFGCFQADSATALLDLAPTDIDVSLISQSPISDCVEEGGSIVVFTIDVDDTTGASYQWSKDGVDLADDAHISGATTPQIEINDVVPTDGGDYTCRVWNDCIDEMNAITTTGVLDLIDPVFLTSPSDTCVEFGGDAVFHGEATSPFFFVYRWYEGMTLLSEGGKFTGTTTDTLTVHNVDAGDDGRQFSLQAIVVNPSCSGFSDSATLSAVAAGECAPCPNSGGDMDNDADFDLVDMQLFTACFGVDVIVQPACACGNLDAGNDIVDLADWNALEQLIGGPL